MAETALPVVVLREILAFAHAPALIPAASSSYDFAKRATEPSARGLHTLARVCRTWRSAVATLLASYEERALSLQFTIGNEEAEVVLHESHLKQCGHLIQDLRIQIVAPKPRLWWEALESSSPSASGAPDPNVATDNPSCHSQWIDWDQLFAHVPNVQRLDLSRVPLHHFSIGDILDAASRRCGHMQALAMPLKERLHAEAVDATIDETFRMLYASLARWHKLSCSEAGGGLLQLTVPSRDSTDYLPTASQFLEAVTKFCPAIEFLDGWKRTYSDQRFVISDESFSVAADVWTKFCATCVHLREFSWVVVPFADEFFVPFGQHTKAQLTHLQLTYNAKAPFRIRRSEYSTDGLCAAVRACPRLQVLDVILHRIQPSHAFVYPHLDEMIDGEVFNDRFVTELAGSCPRIESVRIREVGGGSSFMNSITDSGLHALAGLKHLKSLELQGAKCSARGILSLITELPTNSTAGTKSVKIRELGSQFGEIVNDLLSHLSAEGSEASLRLEECSKPLTVSISSRRGFVFKKSLLDRTFAEVRARYSHLRFVAVLREKPSSRDKDGFARVIAPTLAMSKDVARVGKLILYTDRRLLSGAVQEKIAHRSAVCSCIIQL